MRNSSFLFMLIGCMLIAACHNRENTAAVVAPPAAKKPAIMQPFRFHKMIEVSPGNDFDILSWGRGSDDVGSYLILHSDSSAMKYTTTTGDMDGSIVDVYNSDMDLDGNPEILIQAKATDTANYAIIYAFEFNNSKAQKLDFPKLTNSQRKGYRGGDNFYIQDGKFMREFAIYDGNGKDAKPTGQKRLLQYGLKDNEFTVKQVNKDSTDVNKADNTEKPTVKTNSSTSSDKKSGNANSSNNNSSNSSKSKKNSSNDNNTSGSKKKKHKKEKETTTHHKKKKKHHNSD